MRWPVGYDSSVILWATCLELRPRQVGEERQAGEHVDQLLLAHGHRPRLVRSLVVVCSPALADASDQAADQVERRARVGLDQRQQVPRGERQHVVGLGRLDAGIARLLVDDRQLAEEIARAQSRPARRRRGRPCTDPSTITYRPVPTWPWRTMN